MTKYEYLKEFDCTVDELNILGAQGWELVSTVDSGGVVYFYFKREKE